MYMKKKKILRKILFITVILLLFLFLGGSYYMGTLVVDGSTQLVTNEDTKDISESFGKNTAFLMKLSKIHTR